MPTFQLRHSPVGFRSQWHCTPKPQWVFILEGEMEIGLQDGSSRLFKPGEHFYPADAPPEGASFDAEVHGHWSAQRGGSPLVRLLGILPTVCRSAHIADAQAARRPV
jgi:hypothetical protein